MTNRLLRRLPRAWARLGLVAACTSAVGAGAVALLLHEDGPPARRALPSPASAGTAEAASPRSAAGPTTRPSATPEVRPAAPRSTSDVVAPRSGVSAADLATWVRDRGLEPRLRYAALRRLEAEAPGEAASAALSVLDDVAPLVRLNAIALLARSPDPRAQPALAQLDDTSRRLAGALARR